MSLRSSILIATLVFGIIFSLMYIAPIIAANNEMSRKENCMTVSQIETTLGFDFKNPAYLPPDYHYQCGRAIKGETLVVYWNQPVKRAELDNAYGESHKGAIVQFMQSESQITNGTAEVLSQYSYILKENPSIKPKLIDLGYGNVAWANDAGTMPARLRTYFVGYSLNLEGYVPLDELVKMAKSMQ